MSKSKVWLGWNAIIDMFARRIEDMCSGQRNTGNQISLSKENWKLFFNISFLVIVSFVESYSFSFIKKEKINSLRNSGDVSWGLLITKIMV